MTILVFCEPFGVDLAGVAMGVAVTIFSSVDMAKGGIVVGAVVKSMGESAAHGRGCEWLLGTAKLVHGVGGWNVGGYSGGGISAGE